MIGVFILLIKISDSFPVCRFNEKKIKSGSLFIINLLGFLILAMNYTNVGSISRDGESSRLVDLSFALLQPFYLTIIHIYSNIKYQNKTINITCILLAICAIISGFTGYLLYLTPIGFLWSRKIFGSHVSILLVAGGIASLPLIRLIKFVYINGSESILRENNPLTDLINYYNIFLPIVIDRFTNVYNHIYISNNYSEFSNLVENGANPVFQGYIGSLIYKMTHSSTVENINLRLFQSFASPIDGESNSTFPLLSYFENSFTFGFSITAYYIIIQYAFLRILRTYMPKEEAVFISFLAFFTLLLGGWFWPYMNFFQASIIYFFIKLIPLFRKK